MADWDIVDTVEACILNCTVPGTATREVTTVWKNNIQLETRMESKCPGRTEGERERLTPLNSSDSN